MGHGAKRPRTREAPAPWCSKPYAQYISEQCRKVTKIGSVVMLECYDFADRLRKYLIIRMAEGVRFELTRPFGLPVFKTGAINRSATPPERTVIGDQ